MNIHFHLLFLDGVYVATGDRLTFRRVPPPTLAALEAIVRVISERAARSNVKDCWCVTWRIAF